MVGNEVQYRQAVLASTLTAPPVIHIVETCHVVELRNSFSSVAQVIHHHVLPQFVGIGVERATLVDSGHLVNEVHEVGVGF